MTRAIAALAALALCLWALPAPPAVAQSAKVARIGLLGPTDLAGSRWFTEGLHAGMKELGYVEGRHYQIEARWAEGRFDRLPQLAAELVRLNVDVLVTRVTEASLAAKAATSTIPIVMIGVADPVAVGLVASLARPGGNVTGTAGMSADLVGKQLELLKDIDPALSRVAVLWNPANAAFQALQVREAETAAHRIGVHLAFVEAKDPDSFGDAFAAIRRERLQALLILSDPVYTAHRDALAAHAMKDRLVAVSGIRLFVEAGGLAAYGPSYHDLSRRAATYVDKILKGAKPADLPVEQPTRFELLVNLKTAKALGVTLPPAVLARADEVIE